MKAEDFIKAYEAALATQNWEHVDPLINREASVTFSDGSVHIGRDAVQKAFEKNFATIENEHYAIKDVRWLKKTEHFAVYLFDFEWSGRVRGKLVSGSGFGTSVIIQEKGTWQLLTEHLGKK